MAEGTEARSVFAGAKRGLHIYLNGFALTRLSFCQSLITSELLRIQQLYVNLRPKIGDQVMFEGARRSKLGAIYFIFKAQL